MDKGKIKNFLAPNKEKLILFLIGSILFLAPLLWFWLKIHEPIGEIQIQIPLLLQILFWISVGTGLFVLYIGVCLLVESKKDKRVIPIKKRIILVLSYWFYGAVALSIWWFLLKNKISFLIFFFLFIIGGVIVLFFVSRFLKIPFK